MLTFLLIFSSVSLAGVEARMLECAKALSRAHEWSVPFGEHQSHYAKLYNKEHGFFHIWSEKNPRVLYFYSADKLYVAETPPPILYPRLVNTNYFAVGGLPRGNLYLEYNASGLNRNVRSSLLPEEGEEFSEPPVQARPATAEEEKEAFRLYLDRMGYLWEMRESVKNPSWFSFIISNAGKGTEPPTAKEVQEMESACTVFFSPDAELNCRK